MEPLDDRKLDELLALWRAPDAPATLRRRVRKSRRATWWTWLWTGSIRVPVPVMLVVAAALASLVVVVLARTPLKETAHPPESAGLQPVKRLEVRIIRSKYENNR